MQKSIRKDIHKSKEVVKEGQKIKLLRIYLIVTFFYGLLGFMDALFFTSRAGPVTTYDYLATLVFFSFFLFSIIALVYFVQDNLPKITWILPSYTIVTKIAIVVAALVWASALATAKSSVNSNEVPLLLVYFAVLFSLFESLFSLYLLRKFRLV